MRLSVIAATLLATATVAHAYTYLQCSLLTLQSDFFPAIANMITSFLSPANSVSGCPNFCAGQGSKYSLYQPGVGFGVFGTCYCVDRDPGGSYVATGSNSAGSCPLGTFQVNYMKNAAFTFDRCVTGGTFTYSSVSTVTEQAQCFTKCASYAYMTMQINSNGAITCTCAMARTGGTSVVCQRGVQQLYSSSSVAPSAAARRKRDRRALEAAEAARRDYYCPRGLTPCRIEGTAEEDNAYECLYTAAELESCGGCLYGHMGNATGPIGEDRMPGVPRGATSCVEGSCVASRCMSGYSLRAGRCVPNLVTQR